MDFHTATGQDASYEDQDGNDFIRDAGGFAIAVCGHYTASELRAKLAQLEEANRHFEAKAAAAADLEATEATEAAEAAERTARRDAGIAAAEGELKAAGIDFDMTDADTYATVWRAGVVLGTVSRPARSSRLAMWSFHTPDGALAFKAPGRLTMLRRLIKRFA